ncbi:hypothetical protein EKO23_07635 [Nocardioides guangzhouensis]|uniref:Uncharacterized protein n=1 Tax=Nocardioides guangzhouensis TaxID=2497878 RepID=A0A4V1XZI2_9ACTN|nr:hypothetical protein [Nocardioides guangzhouensis]RYP86839.1 hypothetical protein EKO23_07635 [Nocardioides guangzhouensis]
MNRHTVRDTTRTARRAASLSVAAVVAGLALAPTGAHATQAIADGSGTTSKPTGDKWSYMYDAAQRRDAQVRDQAVHADDATRTSATSSGYVNAWSYMYDDEHGTAVATSHLPLAKGGDDSAHQRKLHPGLANIVVSVAPKAPATCYLPDTVDASTRRLIAVQLCGKAHVVPAVFLARAAVYEPAVYSLGHL